MIARRAIAAGLLALALGGCGEAGLDRLRAGEKARVVEVRSGHVLVLETGLVVRLAGVEAPAVSQPYGAEARDALSHLALGKEVQLLYGGRARDRYDRALAQARLVKGGRWIEGELLEAGAVRVRTWSDNRALSAEMLEIEAKARGQRKGLWALPVYRVLLPQEALRMRGFQIVEGRVGRVGNGAEGVYLDLDGGVSAQLAAAAVDDFTAAGKVPDALRGRLVRVRGMMGGGVIRLDHPEALEILQSR